DDALVLVRGGEGDRPGGVGAGHRGIAVLHLAALAVEDQDGPGPRSVAADRNGICFRRKGHREEAAALLAEGRPAQWQPALGETGVADEPAADDLVVATGEQLLAVGREAQGVAGGGAAVGGEDESGRRASLRRRGRCGTAKQRTRQQADDRTHYKPS